MKRIALFITGLLLLLTRATSSYAQPTIEGEVKSLVGIEVHFRFDNSNLDFSYMGNDRALTRFAHVIDSLGLHAIDSVVIVSQSSPEGRYEHNLKLSRQRAATMREAIEQRHPELSSRLYVHPDGESWAQLRAYVKSDRQMKQETIDQVIDIIDADVSIDTKKWRLEQLPIYRYLLLTYYPRIRNSVFCIIYFDDPIAMAQLDELLPTPSTRAEVEALTLPSWPIANSSQLKAHSSKTIMALKSNLLYDAFTWVNYSLEIPFTERFSALVYHQFPWWTWGAAKNEYCIRFLSVGTEARWWFKPQPTPERDMLMGHFLGLYAESGMWDFQRQRDFCHQGEHWSAGVTYGYARPLGKKLNLEISLSFGYANIPYQGYIPSENYEYLWRDPNRVGRWHFIGPTKAQVSLVLPIVKKGGIR